MFTKSGPSIQCLTLLVVLLSMSLLFQQLSGESSYFRKDIIHFQAGEIIWTVSKVGLDSVTDDQGQCTTTQVQKLWLVFAATMQRQCNTSLALGLLCFFKALAINRLSLPLGYRALAQQCSLNVFIFQSMVFKYSVSFLQGFNESQEVYIISNKFLFLIELSSDQRVIY